MTQPLPTLKAVPMSPARRSRLVELGEFHRGWVTGALPGTRFAPGEGRRTADYNQHDADLDAAAVDEDAFHAGARRIMGLDPVTGRRAN